MKESIFRKTRYLLVAIFAFIFAFTALIMIMPKAKALTLTYNPDPNTNYSLYFDNWTPNGDYISKKYKYGDKIEDITPPTYPNFEFICFNDSYDQESGDGITTWFDVNGKTQVDTYFRKGDQHIYGHWRRTAWDYRTYTLDKKGGTGGLDAIYIREDYVDKRLGPLNFYYRYKSDNTQWSGRIGTGKIDVPTKENAKFGGYEYNGNLLIDANGYLTDAANEYPTYENITLTAKWSEGMRLYQYIGTGIESAYFSPRDNAKPTDSQSVPNGGTITIDSDTYINFYVTLKKGYAPKSTWTRVGDTRNYRTNGTTIKPNSGDKTWYKPTSPEKAELCKTTFTFYEPDEYSNVENAPKTIDGKSSFTLTYGDPFPELDKTTNPRIKDKYADTKKYLGVHPYEYSELIYDRYGNIVKEINDFEEETIVLSYSTQYTSDYNIYDGDTLWKTIKEVPAEEMTDIPVSELPTKVGYIFDGLWSSSFSTCYILADGKHNAGQRLNVSKLYIRWIEATTIALKDENTTIGSTYGINGNNLPDLDVIPTKAGYIFAGYNSSNDGTGTNYYDYLGKGCTIWNNGPTTLYAMWTSDTYFTFLTFDGGEGNIDKFLIDYLNELPSLSEYTFTKTGYTFNGFKDSSNRLIYDEEGNPVIDAYDYTENLVLEAQWSANHYTAQLTGSDYEADLVYDEMFPNIPAEYLPVNPGFTFNGYYDSVTGGTMYCNANGEGTHIWDKAENGVTLYPRWLKNITYTVIDGSTDYDGNNHTISITVTDPTEGVTVKYGTTEGTYDLTSAPEYKNVGEYVIYYEITALSGEYDYKTVNSSITLKITKVDRTELDALITLVQNYCTAINNQGYTNIASQLQTAINTASAASSEDNLTKAQVDEAISNLQSSYDGATALVCDALITNIGTVSYPTSGDAISDALTAYNALADNQKALVTNYTVLEAAIEEYNKQKLDGVKNVKDLIDAIGDVTLDKEDEITSARSAYNALTEEQKELVTNYKTLTDAEAYLDELKNAETYAVAIDNLIMAIGEVTYPNSGEAIKKARDAYDDSLPQTKLLVTKLSILEAAEAEYNSQKLNGANAVIALINGIGTVTLDSEDDINEARSAYDALRDEQKELVTNYETLTLAEARLDELKAAYNDAKPVDDLINAIGIVELNEESKGKIDAAREAYNALSKDAKTFVKHLDVLQAAEAKYQLLYDQSIADTVIALINQIGEVEYTNEFKAKLDNDENAYDILTTAQKELVSNYNDLLAKIQSYNNIDNAVKAIEAIDNVKYNKESKEAIEEARIQYDKLSDSEKLLIPNEEEKLIQAETKYEKAHESHNTKVAWLASVGGIYGVVIISTLVFLLVLVLLKKKKANKNMDENKQE